MHEVTQGKLLLHSIEHVDREVNLISVRRYIANPSLEVLLVILKIQVWVKRKSNQTVTIGLLASTIDNQSIVDSDYLDLTQGVTFMAAIVVQSRWKLIALDVRLRLMDVDKVVINFELQSLRIYQNRVELCPLPQRIDEFFWVFSERYRSSPPLYFFDT